MVEKILNDKDFSKDLAYSEEYDCFFIWENGYYKMLKNHEARRLVLRYLLSQYGDNHDIDMDWVRKVIDMLKLKIYNYVEKMDTHLIAFNDCLYNTKLMACEDHARSKFAILHVPFDYKETKIRHVTKDPTNRFDGHYMVGLSLER